MTAEQRDSYYDGYRDALTDVVTYMRDRGIDTVSEVMDLVQELADDRLGVDLPEQRQEGEGYG